MSTRTNAGLADLQTLFTIGRVADPRDSNLLERISGTAAGSTAAASAALESLIRKAGSIHNGRHLG